MAHCPSAFVLVVLALRFGWHMQRRSSLAPCDDPEAADFRSSTLQSIQEMSNRRVLRGYASDYRRSSSGQITRSSSIFYFLSPCFFASFSDCRLFLQMQPRYTRLLAEKLNPILKEHKKAISETTGRRDVGWVLGWIKVRAYIRVHTAHGCFALFFVALVRSI